MKTVSINVMSLCIPCENRCRYCLLSYDGKLAGADFQRSQRYARRFYEWLQQHRPEVNFVFGFGHSMEHPYLLDAIKFCQSIGSPTGEFLQLDGMKFRTAPELTAFFSELKAGGIQQINLTFYGTEHYHDRFAARAGDYQYMMNMLRAANEIHLPVSVGVPLTQENAAQADDLLAQLQHQLERIYFFIPHCEGRGRNLQSIRFTLSDYAALSPQVKAHFNAERFRPEKDWVAAAPLPAPQKRVLTLTLTQDNIQQFEDLPFDAAIQLLEQLDDDYYAAVPDFNALLRLYGNSRGEKLYSQRDLYLTYQQRFIAEHHLTVYDVNDERQHFSRRFGF